MRYAWSYGIFHWIVHYFLTILLVGLSEIVIFPIFIYYDFFGFSIKANIVDHFLIIVIASLIDLDHLPALKKFGRKQYRLVQKRYIAPLHNFFFLSFFAIISAILAIFVSREAAVVTFAIVLHLLWDISEDVFIFKSSYRRWEKTWGINTKELEEWFKEIQENQDSQPNKTNT